MAPAGRNWPSVHSADDDGPQNTIRVISFTGSLSKDIVVQTSGRLNSLHTLPSGTGFTTVDSRGLLQVDLRGGAKVLWTPPPGIFMAYAMASPDEKQLALSTISRQANVWMMTGF